MTYRSDLIFPTLQAFRQPISNRRDDISPQCAELSVATGKIKHSVGADEFKSSVFLCEVLNASLWR